MVQITPAILTKDVEQLKSLLYSYLEAGFLAVDIDIQETPFVSDATLSLVDALKMVRSMDLPNDLSIGWDLKIKQPKSAVDELLADQKESGRKDRIYVYSSAQLNFTEEYDCNELGIGIGVLGDVDMKGIQFFNSFPEVQLMTISAEKQGSKLDYKLLQRAAQLRTDGYTGVISLDGGVNLRSAELINAYAKEVRIDRVSVGSYFQKSANLVLDKQKLDLALNI